MKNSFFKLTLAALFLTLTSQIAEASSKYEKIKAMYDQAVAPRSESNFIDRVTRLNGCVEFTSSNPNQNISQSLVVVTRTINGGGPEFPDRVLKGLGFMRADADSEKFFESYASNLNSSEFSIKYEYQYFESLCYNYPDGSSYCFEGSPVTIGANSQFRISKDYVVYKKVPDIYGYCWGRK
jgi:hypothetical protein